MNQEVVQTLKLEGMIHLPGGTFTMGSDNHYPEEKPAHKVSVAPFWIDRHAVTNRQFAEFVAATGHVTLAEKPADPADYPGADPELLVPASLVLVPPPGPVDKSNMYNWWQYVAGANWRHPRGANSSIEDLQEHPVVHVAFADALAFAVWAGKELPSEAEWEYASKGGNDNTEFAWGDELVPEGRYMANTWQGEFPWENHKLDGYEFTAPVGSFPANGFDLYDMIGNVWEWTTDWYQDHGRIQKACCTLDNPRGGERDASVDPNDTAHIPRRVTKGGSHACAPSYCRRYRPAARMAQPVDTSTSHVGFRCIVRANTGA
ncbi:formylglycine-generating enzyme family protein [Stenotrophomonas sp. SY1]|jgi:sulfatase modifying factor 1|uniref:formylglycine-generating enzyme family protein n=1 Tax=Stenotrophomonas sp. SY1 TaxID=477235 RepID=UPI001E5D5587|nr:formylglycine-generating enzyme family protein [Stenotrophomonas sp. SY1]MCD9087082.1 formylglycine-generating enzyme family protein [Stenotrophomonas sp. SY1]